MDTNSIWGYCFSFFLSIALFLLATRRETVTSARKEMISRIGIAIMKNLENTINYIREDVCKNYDVALDLLYDKKTIAKKFNDGQFLKDIFLEEYTILELQEKLNTNPSILLDAKIKEAEYIITPKFFLDISLIALTIGLPFHYFFPISGFNTALFPIFAIYYFISVILIASVFCFIFAFIERNRKKLYS